MKILLNKSVQMLDFDMKLWFFWGIRPLPIKQNRPHLLTKPSRSKGKMVSEVVNARLCVQTKHLLTLWLEAVMVLDQILDRDPFNMQPGQRRPASVPLQDPSGSPALVGSSSSLTRVWNTWIEEPENFRFNTSFSSVFRTKFELITYSTFTTKKTSYEKNPINISASCSLVQDVLSQQSP